MRGNPLARRGGLCLDALQATYDGPQWVTNTYGEFGGGLLVVYGSGAPDRREAIRQHKGNWVAFDLGYWNREDTFRVSVNAEHPMPAQLKCCDDPSRLRESAIALRDDYCPDGHIVLVGMGPKSRIWQPGYEAAELARIRAAYPHREIVFRPKPGKEPPPGIDAPHVADGPIERVLRGASLVVCKHSNVAIDACIAGIPVVCDGGAAAALYGNDLSAPRQPSPAARLRFLQQLAWWQWSRQQISSGEFWPWLERVLYA